MLVTYKKKFKKIKNPNLVSNPIFRLFDFQTFDFRDNQDDSSDDSSDSKKTNIKKDTALFRIQMFGINEIGETCLIHVNEYNPFFYVKVGPQWDQIYANCFLHDIRQKVKPYFASSIKSATIVKHCQLYDFTGNTEFNFVKLTFYSMSIFNKVRNLWYEYSGDQRIYIPYKFRGEKLSLYESKIPPLLRYFHIQNISPSGWIEITGYTVSDEKKSTCNYEYICNPIQIIPLLHKETPVPYKICSFDIEASSSHGDFPLPNKDYKRFATQVVDVFISRLDNGNINDKDTTKAELLFKKMILAAFDVGSIENIDPVYPKKTISKEIIKNRIQTIFKKTIKSLQKEGQTCDNANAKQNVLKISSMLQKAADESKSLKSSEETVNDSNVQGGFGSGICEIAENIPLYYNNQKTSQEDTSLTIIQLLLQPSSVYDRETKIRVVNEMFTLDAVFPELKGDEVTFIGSTFMNYGQKEPYLNHCIVVGTCDPIPGVIIQSVKNEATCLKTWARLIQDENPDIIIGYNIFGFDYTFLFQRAQELSIVNEFMTFSRILNEPCFKEHYSTGEKSLEQTKNRLASGEYDLRYPKISGRLQIDLLFYFRRDYNLPSYKLDDVASSFIRDDIKGLVSLQDENNKDITHIYTKNIVGLHSDDFIHLEITTFTIDYYQKGKKFRVIDILKNRVVLSNTNNISGGTYNVIVIEGHYPDLDSKTQVLKWGISKDDVSPQDIFRLSRESSASRAIVAKYCIQDCNLVQHLINKTDALTGYNEMARICTVPVSFLVFRGQGIKLTSYVAKVCREQNTLMPDLEHIQNDDGYEGAIVLPPICDMYGDNPVACNDYSSLYPSIAKAWNLSPNSKVWTKLYDIHGNIKRINDIQVTDANKDILETNAKRYENIPGYSYIITEFDHFETKQKCNTTTGKLGRKEKEKCGKKMCCWAQFPNGKEGIIPSIIGDLLTARRDTRLAAEIESDPFMANVLDKRQLGYKVTANSLYGQMGSSVSTFFEKDVAASITSIGRTMITYAKRMIEEIYGNSVYTSNGCSVKTNAQCVYGDTDSVFFTFNLTEVDTGDAIRGKRALELTIKIAQEAAELCSLFLPPPMKLAYEKTLMSFILLSKKRYVGILYETDPNKGKLKFMGLPLKRRDSCDYVKDVYGGILTILMKESNNMNEAIELLNTMLKRLVNGELLMDKLAITKSLRSDYKNPQQISHRVLANRMGERDPGNKPKPGDRIKFVFIINRDKKNTLLGERIETLDYITKNKLQIDYTYYITNQLMHPLQQLLGLALEKIYQYKNLRKVDIVAHHKYIDTLYQSCMPHTGDVDLELFMKKKEKYCSSQVKLLLFDPFLTDLYNRQNGIQTLFNFYKKR
jgi:DNA polymerase elongation subunit (family B)